MPSAEQQQLLKDFYGHLEDRPLDPEIDKAFYHPFLADSDDDPVADMAARIGFSSSESVNLFTGQRGCGKSTELRRLKHSLENDGCVVFLLDMRQYMNLTTPVELSDFFVSIMGALSEAVTERFDKTPQKRGYLERIVDLLQKEIEIEEIKFKPGTLDIKASLKDDPTFKQRLQQGLRGHVARIVKESHGFAQEIVELVRKETGDEHKKVVVLVDSVEQIRGVGADGAQLVYRSVENLFSGHAESLQIPMLHVVYTVPPYLTPLAPGLGRQLGCMVCTLPSVHIKDRKDKDDGHGLEIMHNIITRRCDQWEQIYSAHQIQRLAKASGGDLRDFFRLMRDTVIKASHGRIDGGLPIQDAVIEQSENHLRREMLPIAEEDKQWLRKIAESKDPELESIEKLPQLARFFDTNLVLNYRNGDDWYDIHPLLMDEIKE